MRAVLSSLAIVSTMASERTSLRSQVQTTGKAKSCQSWCKGTFAKKGAEIPCTWNKCAALLEDWTIGPTCKNWCKASFLNKNPVAVCKYMKENVPKCTGCEPCIEKPIAAVIAQPPVVNKNVVGVNMVLNLFTLACFSFLFFSTQE